MAKLRRAAGRQPNAAREQLSRAYGDMLVSMFFPTISRAFELFYEARMKLDLTRLSLALAAWRSEKGGYPAELDELSPVYLKAIPNDLFTGKALIYKPRSSGYLLYSVGCNMKDDGGKDRDADGDDVVVKVE